jgi:putative phosphoribosyl transferase
MQFQNREEAGKILAKKLLKYRDEIDTLVLALPRGGVPVAVEVAKAINAPLDLFMVRKLGVPGHEELGFGAVATGGVRILNPHIIQAYQLPKEAIDRVTETELREMERRQRAYRDERPLPHIQGKTILLIDDGLATGTTMRAAILALRQQHPKKIVVGVPTAAAEICNEFRNYVDEIVCAIAPELFYSVGLWYKDFSQLTDEEVRGLLAEMEEPSH